MVPFPSKYKSIAYKKSKFKFSLKDFPKTQQIIKDNNFSCILEQFNSTELKFVFFKPVFMVLTDKMKSQYFSPHYGTAKGPFTLASIEKKTMKLNSGFSIQEHTSGSLTKHTYPSFTKTVNDYMCQKFHAGEFGTTLIPTDAKYTCSYGYPEYFFHHYDTHNNIFNKNISFVNTSNSHSHIRTADQYELLKSAAFLEYNFNLAPAYFRGFDNKLYYLRTPLLESILTQQKISYHPLELDLVSTPLLVNSILPEVNFSFQDAVLNKKIKKFHFKEKSSPVKESKTIYLGNTLKNHHVSAEVGKPGSDFREDSSVSLLNSSLAPVSAVDDDMSLENAHVKAPAGLMSNLNADNTHD